MSKLHRGRIFAYIRVSTPRQGDSGLGLEAQFACIKDYCTQHKLPFDPQNKMLPLLRKLLDPELHPSLKADLFVELESMGLYLDVESAAKFRMKDRPAGKQMLLDASPGDIIITSKLDRAFRNLRDCCEMFEKMGAVGINFCVVNLGGMAIDFRTPTGKLILHIMAAVAQFEREMISERTKDALAASKARGRRQGNYAPIGYKWRSTKTAGVFELVPDPNMQDCIVWMKALYADGYNFEQVYRQFCLGKTGARRTLWHKRRMPLSRPGEYRVVIVPQVTEWTPGRIREVVLDLIEFDRSLLARDFEKTATDAA